MYVNQLPKQLHRFYSIHFINYKWNFATWSFILKDKFQVKFMNMKCSEAVFLIKTKNENWGGFPEQCFKNIAFVAILIYMKSLQDRIRESMTFFQVQLYDL